MNDDTDTPWSLATLAVAGVAIALLLMWVREAPGRERPTVCLTKKEARQLWPKQHIYWFSKDHCWSNRRGPPRNLKFDPVFSKAHAEEVKQHPNVDSTPDAHKNRPGSGGSRAVIKIVKWGDFNELDAAADADTFFNAEPFTYQAYVPNLDRYRTTFWYRQIWGLAKESK